MIEQILSPELVQALGWTLVHSLWQAAAFALGLGALLVGLRKFSARARYNVAISTLLAFFLTVGLTFSSLYEAPGSTNARSTAVAGEAVARSTSQTASGANTDFNVAPANPATNNRQPATFKSRMVNYYNDHLPLIVTLWLMGVLLLQLRFIGQLAYLQRLKNYGTERFPAKWAPMLQELEAAIGVSKPVRYLSSFRVGSPFTAGWLRPVVLFPAALLAELKEPELRTIMAHELAHIKRHDFLVNLGQTLLCILFFYHPAVWWMSSRIEEEREHCCDDLAIAVTGERVGYAKTLIQLKEQEGTPQMAMGYLGQGGGFKQRVTRLLSGYLGTGTYSEGFTSAVIIAGIMAVAVTLSAQNGDKAVTFANNGEAPAGATSPVAAPEAPARPESPVRPTRPGRAVISETAEGSHSDVFDDDYEDFVMPGEDSTAFIFLLEACDDGNVELARFLLNQGVDVNEVDWNGWTPLMVAAGENEADIVRLLITAGADVNYVNRDGWTALIEAADEGSYESAEALLKAGADVNLTGPGNNRTPLAMAASEGQTQVFTLLVEYGADIFSVKGDGSPLHEAAEEGKLDMVKRLIDLGADAGARDGFGRTPLSYAAEEGNADVVRYLLKNGANPNDYGDDGRTALMYAAHETQAEVTTALLAFGAQATMKDKRGMNALDYAAEELGSMDLYWRQTKKGNRPSSASSRNLVLDHPIDELIKALVKAGATSGAVGVDEQGVYVKSSNRFGNFGRQVEDYEQDQGRDGLVERTPNGRISRRTDRHTNHVTHNGKTLTQLIRDDQNEQAEKLIALGADVDAIDAEGFTPLTMASAENHNIDTENLLKAGANINKVDGNDYTPLTMAAKHNHISTVKTLLAMGAKPNLEDGNDRTAKGIALRDGSTQVLRLLNDAGGNVTAVNADGTSPLEIPAREGDLKSLQFLLDQGTPPNGGTGCPAVFYAAQEGHGQAIRLLADFRANLEPGCNYRDVDYFGRKIAGGKYAVYENATPLMVALTQRNVNAVRALIDAGADPNNSCRKHQFQSPEPIDVSIAARLTLSELGNRYELLFNVSGWTPLMEAVLTNDPTLVRLLLDAGADKNRSLTGGKTALSLAEEIDNSAIITLLTR